MTQTETFEYLLNAMENAAAQETPADHDYAGKRRAVLAYVDAALAERKTLEAQHTRDRDRVWALTTILGLADFGARRPAADSHRRRNRAAETSRRSPPMTSPSDSPVPRTFRQRFACWLGNHPATRMTHAPYPYPSRVECANCGRTMHYIDEHATLNVWSPQGWKKVTNVRYRDLDQWLEERS